MSEQKNNLVANPNVISVLAGNPGAAFSPADLAAIHRGTLTLIGVGGLAVFPGGPVPKGCITRLFYGSGSEDLGFIQIDGTHYNPVNLKDFRERIEDAANHGHRLNFCLDSTTNRMSMLNIYPCKCCDDER